MPGWEEIRARRLARSRLGARAGPRSLVRVVGEVCGLHAQVHSSAELQAWARVEGAAPRRVSDALWKRRSLVRSWAMRGTLHLLPAADLPLYVAALRTQDRWWKGAWLRFVDLSADQLRALLEAIRESLGAEPRTREELAEDVGSRLGPAVRERMASGWGELLKPAAFHGYLCSGPPRGQNVTFVRPDAWLGGWEEHDEQEALAEVVRRYLRAYGPATREDFARWWGVQPAPAGRALKLIEGEIEEIEVDGHRGWVLGADMAGLRRAELEPSARLLPGFDPYVVGFRPRDLLVEKRSRGRVFRRAGWISPTILVDGAVAGVWSHERVGDRLEVRLELFRKLSRRHREQLRAETDRLASFLGAAGGRVRSVAGTR